MTKDLTLAEKATNYDTMRHVERHHDGNIRRSVEINADRFGLSPQLVRILENTAALLD